jgi:hypothetical protein
MFARSNVSAAKNRQPRAVARGCVVFLVFVSRVCFDEKILAERVGFEPTVPCGTTHFECVRFGRSRTSPGDEQKEKHSGGRPVAVAAFATIVEQELTRLKAASQGHDVLITRMENPMKRAFTQSKPPKPYTNRLALSSVVVSFFVLGSLVDSPASAARPNKRKPSTTKTKPKRPTTTQQKNPTNPGDALPGWLTAKIAEAEKSPKMAEFVAVFTYQVGSASFYYFTAPCCDQFNAVYNDQGTYVCSPDGGFTGAGRQDCSADHKQPKEMKQVWKAK